MNGFGQWLQRWRKEASLTQEQVAEKVGYTAGHISGLERGVVVSKKGTPVRPDLDLVDALARVLRRPTAEARLAAGYAPRKLENISIPAEQAVEYIEALPPETQGDALAILELLYRRHSQAATQAKDSLPRPLGEPELVRVPVIRPKDWAPERKRDVQTKKKAEVQVQQKRKQ